MQQPQPFRFLRRLIAARAGSTIIEFAVVAPIFFMLFLGIIEFGLIQFSKVALESATAQVARDTTLGRVSDENCPDSIDRVAYMRCLIEHRTLGLINGDQVYVTANVVNGRAGGVEFNPDICLKDPPTVGGDCPEGTGYEEVNGIDGYQGERPPTSVGDPGDLIELKAYYPWRVTIPFMNRFFGDTNSETGERTGVLMLTSSTVVRNEPYDE